MYYVSSIKDNKIGITDSKDNVEEFFTYTQVGKMREKGLSIYGVGYYNGKLKASTYLGYMIKKLGYTVIDNTTLIPLRLAGRAKINDDKLRIGMAGNYLIDYVWFMDSPYDKIYPADGAKLYYVLSNFADKNNMHLGGESLVSDLKSELYTDFIFNGHRSVHDNHKSVIFNPIMAGYLYEVLLTDNTAQVCNDIKYYGSSVALEQIKVNVGNIRELTPLDLMYFNYEFDTCVKTLYNLKTKVYSESILQEVDFDILNFLHPSCCLARVMRLLYHNVVWDSIESKRFCQYFNIILRRILNPIRGMNERVLTAWAKIS